MAGNMATVGNISQIQVGADSYNIVGGLFYGEVDSTSTSTAFTATIPNLKTTALYDGLTVVLKNGVVTSASGFTINVNGLGAKPCYNNMATGNDETPTKPTRDTTIFNINYTMMFIYNSTLVSGGAWICYRGYDGNTNTIYSDFTGATTSAAGEHGLVPIPAAGENTYILLGDGGWHKRDDVLVDAFDDYFLGEPGIIIYSNGNLGVLDGTPMSSAQAEKLAGIETGANNYTHPAYTAATAAAVKVGRDATGHVVIGNALTASDVGASATDHTHDAGDITSGTLGTARIPSLSASKITYGIMSQLRVQPIYYQAHGSGTINLTAGPPMKVTLVRGGALSSGSGLAIVSGGIKITTAGRYRITASAYVQNDAATAALGRGVYVYKAASSGAFSAAAEIFSAVDSKDGESAGAICCGPKIVECAANDIVYLAARSMNAAGTCYQDNVSTYLLVERLS